MRWRLPFIAGALATCAALVHCGSQDDASVAPEDGGGPDVTVQHEAGADAPSASDAAMLDEFEIPDAAVVCEDAPCAVALTAATSQSWIGAFCALLSDHTVECWGSNVEDALGYATDGGALDGAYPMSSLPKRVTGLSNVTSVSAGGDNGCARVADGGVFCWGAPDLVNAGASPDGGPLFAAPVLAKPQPLVPAAETVAVGTGTACVTTATGSLSCWGDNSQAQLARPASPAFARPADVAISSVSFAAARPGAGRTFALTTRGAIVSWGSNHDPGCGLPNCGMFLLGRDTSEDPDPGAAVIPGLAGARDVSSAEQHACAVVGRFVQCWGDDNLGELGRGALEMASMFPGPTVLSAVTDAEDADAGRPGHDVPIQVVAQYQKTCAVMGSGRIYCWGGFSDSHRDWGVPTRVDGLSGPAVGLAMIGNTTSCALLRSGVVECWGANLLGLLGRGNPDDDLDFEDPNPAPVHFAP